MRQDIGHKDNGLTEANISVDNSPFFNSRKQFFCFLLSSPHFGFDEPVLAITNLAHLLLPCRQADANAKSKELNFLTHGGFFKTILAIPKLSTFIFAGTKAKINKLNCLPSLNGMLRTFFARVLTTPKGAPQAYGNFCLLVDNQKN